MEQATTTFIILKELAGNPPPRLNAIQEFLVPYTELLVQFWVAVWVVTILTLLWVLWYEYKKQRGE